MLGVSLKDRIKNVETRRRIGVTNVVKNVARLEWQSKKKINVVRDLAAVETKGVEEDLWSTSGTIARNCIQTALERTMWKQRKEAYV